MVYNFLPVVLGFYKFEPTFFLDEIEDFLFLNYEEFFLVSNVISILNAFYIISKVFSDSITVDYSDGTSDYAISYWFLFSCNI